MTVPMSAVYRGTFFVPGLGTEVMSELESEYRLDYFEGRGSRDCGLGRSRIADLMECSRNCSCLSPGTRGPVDR